MAAGCRKNKIAATTQKSAGHDHHGFHLAELICRPELESACGCGADAVSSGFSPGRSGIIDIGLMLSCAFQASTLQSRAGRLRALSSALHKKTRAQSFPAPCCKKCIW